MQRHTMAEIWEAYCSRRLQNNGTQHEKIMQKIVLQM